MRKYSDDALKSLYRDVKHRAEILYLAAPGTHNAGSNWYPEANRIARRLAAAGDLSLFQAAGAMAVLSPQIAWQDALIDTWKVLWGDTEGFMALPANVAKAYAIIHEADLSVISGKKVTAFYSNICEPTGPEVTLDTHMARMFGIHAADVFDRYGVYGAMEKGVQRAAEVLGIYPPSLQASLWIAYKGYNKRINYDTTEVF